MTDEQPKTETTEIAEALAAAEEIAPETDAEREYRERAEAREKEQSEDHAKLCVIVEATNAEITERNHLVTERIEILHGYRQAALHFELDRTHVRFEEARKWAELVYRNEKDTNRLEESVIARMEEYEKARREYEKKWHSLPTWFGAVAGILGMGAIGLGLWGSLRRKPR